MFPIKQPKPSTKLTKCFFSAVHSDKATPYGITNNQIRAKGIINSAGWFNSLGERLGKGDLSLKDMATISKHIQPDDLFVVLRETDSFHNMPADLDYLAPGRDYVLRNAVWVIGAGGVIIRVREDLTENEDGEQEGVKYVRMAKSEFLIASKVGTKPKDDAQKAKAIEEAKAVLAKQTPKALPPQPVLKKGPAKPTAPATIAKTVAAPLKPSSGKPMLLPLKPVGKKPAPAKTAPAKP